MRISLIVLLLLVLIVPARGLNEDRNWKVSGTVSNMKGDLLPGATIVVSGTYLGSYTDIDGVFEFPKIREGKYSFVFSYLGYHSRTIEITVDRDVNIDVTLENEIIITEEIIVRGIRASSVTPVAHTSLKAGEIRKINTGQDLPYLLALQPSVIATSEAGTGIGYTGLRIRGSDASRINVTLDGIPLNDSESQQVFWVNMPDIVASVSEVQVQRGVGTSTNGAGAFGASINMTVSNPSDKAYAELSTSLGSFSTAKVSAKIGSGLLGEKFKLDMRFSGVQSSGYIDRAGSSHRSLLLTGQYRLKSSILKANFIHGEEVTGISWWGVPADSLATNRTYNPAGEYRDTQGNIRYYNGQDDNYVQTHFHLIYNWQINDRLFLKTAGHFTRGAGYYEQYKEDQKLSEYDLPNWILHGLFEDVFLDRTDLIRRKWLYNFYYGGVFNLNYNTGRLDLSIGGALNRYVGDHFGTIIWMRWAGTTETGHQWYINGGQKDEFNIYTKLNYSLSGRIKAYADIQYRNIDYTIQGNDDDLRFLNIANKFNFINPKAGLFFTLNANQDAFLSFAVANKEPTRANYKDAAGDDSATPLPETLYDFEAGYMLRYSRFSAGINLYYMLYSDQLVPTGKLSNVGYPIMTNVANSYRAGIEISASIRPVEMLEWKFTSTFSRNIIKDFTEYASNYIPALDITEEISIYHKDVDIAYSPSVVASGDLGFYPFKDMGVHFISKYVGKQYFDNTQSENRKIDPYLVSNLRLDYDLSAGGRMKVGLQLLVSNIFNTLYENNAYGGSWYEDMQEYTWAYYFPQAGTSYLARLTLLF
ncbi:MAG: TonB-dependent receptor [Marinilabiliaceae bacterium]|jgi:iron complex outermembrane receptor protein|nr:TonB-dependent receptor [Marinilabiliaceae bacterium]